MKPRHPIDPGMVRDPDHDGRVTDADRFRDDRRREAIAMIALWERSRKPWAGDELRFWRAVLTDIDGRSGEPEQPAPD